MLLGTALAGVTGLPTAAIPDLWSDPNDTKGDTVVARLGESTVDYARNRFVLTNNYAFTGDKFLKGFGVDGTVWTARSRFIRFGSDIAKLASP